MDFYYEITSRASFRDSIKALEVDIQHANVLAASIPRSKNVPLLQMKLRCSELAPFCMMLMRLMGVSYSCLFSSSFNLFHVVIYKVYAEGKRKRSSIGRKATIRDFYGVILPSLERLHCDANREESNPIGLWSKKRKESVPEQEREREDECGICLEPCTKMVVPSCCHSMCINCYRDWNNRSESCPFCRGSLKRVNSCDLWVLPCNSDRVDTSTVLKEDSLRFLLFINELPKDVPDALFIMYYEFLI